MMALLSLAIHLSVAATLVWLAIVDVRSRRLPTKGVLLIGAFFLADAIISRMPIDMVFLHLAVALAVLLACAGLFAAKLLGGGDAKLAAVIFLWLGMSTLLPALTLISVIGTLVSLISLATWNMDSSAHTGPMRVLAMFSAARGVPYGVALAAGGGAVIVLPSLLPYLLRR